MAEIRTAEVGIKACNGQDYPIGGLGLVGAVVGYEGVNDLVWNILGREHGKEYLDENIDFVSTLDIFSMGNVSSYTIVSNRVYTVLKNAKLTRNLNFEPVITI